MLKSPSFHVRTSVVVVLSATACAPAADLQLIYSEILSSPTSIVPGALDAAGQPVVTTWASLAVPGVSVRINGDEWVVNGTTSQVSTLSAIMVRGCGSTGSMFLQEGQPVQGGGEAGETYSFFDNPPVHFNASGLIAYSLRAAGGVTTNDEKLGTFNGTTHTILLTQNSPIIPLGGSCDSAGNSIGSVTALDSGVVAWGNTPLNLNGVQCTATLYYPAAFHGNQAVMQCEVTTITSGQVGEEKVDDFSFSAVAFSPDGQHILVDVDTNNPNTAADRVLLLDTAVILREGSAIPGSSLVMSDVTTSWYAPNGDWYARGIATTAADWAMRNGVLLAETGDPITTGSSELFGDTLHSFVGNADGDWIIVGNTNNADANLNTVLVLNGTQVLAREGDPIDVDDDGLFDDDAFIATFTGDGAYITNDDVLYFVGSLRNGAGTNIGSMMIRSDLDPACVGNTDSNNAVDVLDLLAVINAWGPCAGCGSKPCPADVAPECPDCAVNVLDLLVVINAWGPCP